MHILANLIKVFFRELPESIFSKIPEATIYKIARLPIDQVETEMETALGVDKSIILWLLDLMAIIVKNEDENRMSAKNMAIGIQFSIL